MTEETINRHSFILRIWREGENMEWKGWVQHADSGESIYLLALSDLRPFIEKHIGAQDKSKIHKSIHQKSARKPGLK